MRQLAYFPFACNNLVPTHLRWRKLCENVKKSTNNLFMIVWNISFWFLLLWKCVETAKMIILCSKNVRHLHKYYHTALGTALKTKLLLNVKGQNRGFWKTSNLGLCPSSVALNKSLKNKWNFWNTKIFKNFKFYGIWTELEMKICLLWQPCTKFNV